ncbi:protein tipE [Atheta coriaria]|uniref:protein tipE n=1 Tax=Dalotia coriaria TaxID=877792 RepID=UPI0031F4344C
MEEEPGAEEQTLKQKVLFYITAFFVLLGIFSLFAFLFLVPFVIDPAFTTVFMEFDERPAWCVTMDAERRLGVSNCTWSSCREGCTKDTYTCTQVRVNYRLVPADFNYSLIALPTDEPTPPPPRDRRAAPDHPAAELDRDYDYYVAEAEPTGLMGNDSEWYYVGAKLLPNVKGCGYPPMLNCSIWLKRYQDIGTNFSCYYSRVDPGIVISHLDMWQVYMNLVYAMAIPIPSFILSIIYLTFAYFKIYSEDEEEVPLEKNAEAMDMEGESSLPDETPLQPTSSGATPSEAFREDLASFGHHFKVAMADEMSRESFADGVANSISIPGHLTTMTTSISMTGGPIADI